MNKNNPFKVPDNYFQDFKMEIMDKLPENNKAKKNSLINHYSLKWSAMVAVIAIFITIGISYMNRDSNSTTLDLIDLKQNNLNTTTLDQQYASLQNDYLLFIEDQAALSIYKDVLGLDDF